MGLAKKRSEASNIYFRKIARQPGCRSEWASQFSFFAKEKE